MERKPSCPDRSGYRMGDEPPPDDRGSARTLLVGSVSQMADSGEQTGQEPIPWRVAEKRHSANGSSLGFNVQASHSKPWIPCDRRQFRADDRQTRNYPVPWNLRLAEKQRNKWLCSDHLAARILLDPVDRYKAVKLHHRVATSSADCFSTNAGSRPVHR